MNAIQPSRAQKITRALTMSLRLVAALCLIAVVARAGASQAQDAGTLRVDAASVVPGEFPQATAVLNIDDTSGGNLEPLGIENFVVTVNGQAAPVQLAELASAQDVPLEVLLASPRAGLQYGPCGHDGCHRGPDRGREHVAVPSDGRGRDQGGYRDIEQARSRLLERRGTGQHQLGDHAGAGAGRDARRGSQLLYHRRGERVRP
jgi:hypothetical protein